MDAAELVLCLKRIRKSIDRWNKAGGRDGTRHPRIQPTTAFDGFGQCPIRMDAEQAEAAPHQLGAILA